MPTTRQSHIRRLIKAGKAVVINGNPFTVRLKYETPDIVQNIYVGMDTGRENIGEGASLEDGTGVYLAETQTNNKTIKQNMAQRKGCRQGRRRCSRQKRQRTAASKGNEIEKGNNSVLRNYKPCKSVFIIYPGAEGPAEHKVVRGKEAKFANRKRNEGWLTPSARQLIQMHLLTFQKTRKILPVSDLTIERVSFDFQKLDNAEITDWNHGPLYGYNNYKEYIRDQQNGKCLLCGCNHIDEYHHIVPRSQGGSNTVNNIAGLCSDCHKGINGVHKSEEAVELLRQKKDGCREEYKVSLLNSAMPYLLKEMQKYCEENSIRFHGM